MADQVYTSLGGSDIHAVFGNYKFGSIQMIRYASSREKAQIYTLGSPSARATARGKRSVSGAFVFTLIDRKGLVKAMAEAGSDSARVFLSNDEIANFANSANNAIPNSSDAKTKAAQAALLAGGTTGATGVLGSNYSPFTNESIFAPSNFGEAQAPYISDQLLPFDITIVGLPEYGSDFAKRLIIHGVEILTEASGTSIDDLVIEKQHSFIARSISDWVSLAEISGATGTGNNSAKWG
jgi:hypothetical protein